MLEYFFLCVLTGQRISIKRRKKKAPREKGREIVDKPKMFCLFIKRMSRHISVESR